MSDRFAENNPAFWTEDDVLVVRKLARDSVASLRRQASSWRFSIAPLAFFGLTVASLAIGSSQVGSPSDLLVSRERLRDDIVKMERAGPGRDVVPSGYWKALDEATRRMPELADDDSDDDYEPFI